jgi:hypothetical protein
MFGAPFMLVEEGVMRGTLGARGCFDTTIDGGGQLQVRGASCGAV